MDGEAGKYYDTLLEKKLLTTLALDAEKLGESKVVIMTKRGGKDDGGSGKIDQDGGHRMD